MKTNLPDISTFKGAIQRVPEGVSGVQPKKERRYKRAPSYDSIIVFNSNIAAKVAGEYYEKRT
jgi:hypothetical protein